MEQAILWVWGATLAVLVAEVIAGRHRRIYTREDALVLGGCVLLSQLTRPAISFAIATVVAWVLPAHRGALASAPVIPSVIVLLVVGEFLFYWVHRSAHHRRNRLLYGLHRTHHSANYMNVTTALRLNIFWSLFQPFTWVLAVAFYLGMYQAGLFMFVFLQVWGALTHTSFRWDEAIARHSRWGDALIRGLEWVMVTPRMHHTHHGHGRDGKTSKNLCVNLSIFDRLFGTLYIPQGRPEHYGLPDADPHWLQQIMFPLRLPARFRGERPPS